MSVSGRPFLQIPGPTNVPDRILRAMDRPVIDHRGPEFAALTKEILPPLREVFGTREGAVVLYPSSGTGAWEAALVNVLAAGERVLAFNYGQFSALFAQTARNLGYEVDEVPLRWGQELPAEEVERRLREDRGDKPYAAVLMLPPGLGLVCAGPRALARGETGGTPRNFFDWRPIIRDNEAGFFPYTPATLLLYGLREALKILVDEEGLDAVYARHQYLADAVRAAVAAWGLSNLCEKPEFYSNTLTAVVVPEGKDSDEVVRIARERFGLALGIGLTRIKGKVFRIGHLGALNELEVLGTLGGVEMALAELGVLAELGSGVAAAQRLFARTPEVAGRRHGTVMTS